MLSLQVATNFRLSDSIAKFLLVNALHQRGIYTAVISNSDARSRQFQSFFLSRSLKRSIDVDLVLKDLKFPESMVPIVLSEQEGIEKPAQEIFLRTLERVSTLRGEQTTAGQSIHVGDELDEQVLICSPDLDFRTDEQNTTVTIVVRRRRG
jgi:hypothetical protein